MTTRIATARPSGRRPHDYGAVLLVTGAAARDVWEQLNGAVDIAQLAHGPLDVPRYRVTPRGDDTEQGNPSGFPLTPREHQVLHEVALGKTNLEIARELCISVETARTHMTHILRKAGAANRTHAVHIAHIRGWLSGSDSAG